MIGFRKPDDSVLWLSMSAQPLFDDPNAPPSGCVTTIADITQRKQLEQQRAMEHKVTRLLAESESLEEVIPKLLQSICEALGCACGARRLWNEREQEITCAETWSVPSEEVEAFIAHSRDPWSLPAGRWPGQRVIASSGPYGSPMSYRMKFPALAARGKGGVARGFCVPDPLWQ